MELAITWSGRVAVAHIEGAVDTESSELLGKELQKVIAKRPKGLVFDLTQVPTLTLAGLAALVKASREVRQLGGEAAIAALEEGPVAQVLAAERVSQTIPVEPTVCLAVTDLQAKSEYVRV